MAPPSHARTDDPGRPAGRGQTGFDFLVGMSVFLVAIGLVLGFVPSMFQPFDTDTGPDMVTADRSAARLAEDLLVEDATEPGVLNDTCTEAFFDTGVTDPSGCRFDEDASDVNAALDVDDFTELNVSIESGGSVAMLGTQRLAVGRTPPSTADVVAAERVVLVDGRHMTLFVRVW